MSLESSNQNSCSSILHSTLAPTYNECPQAKTCPSHTILAAVLRSRPRRPTATTSALRTITEPLAHTRVVWIYRVSPSHGESAQRSLSQQLDRAITYCKLVHAKAGGVGIVVIAKLEVRDTVASWVPVPLGLESPPPVVILAAAEEDELVEDDEFVDRVVLGAIEEVEMLKAELLASKVVATADLPAGVRVVKDDPLTDVVTDKLDPVANSPQLLPAQERP